VTQYARPNSDIQTTGWTHTGSAFYTEIDEEPYNDNDYIRSSNGATNEIQMGLSPVTDPQTNVNHTIRFRAYSTGSGQPEQLTAYLRQGTTLIATYNPGNLPRGTPTEEAYTLTAAEADAITDYGALRICFQPTQVGAGENVTVTWARFEVPDASQVYQKSFAITEASVVAPLRRQRRAIGIVEVSTVTPYLKFVYTILVAITMLAALSIQRTQRRSISIQEAGPLQVAKAQSRAVTVTEASNLSVAKRQRRLQSITESSVVTAAKKFVFKIAAAITESTAVAVVKAQSRLLGIQESATITVSKLQSKLVAIQETSFLTLQKQQRRLLSIAATSTVAVTKKQFRRLQVSAVSIVSFVKQVFAGGGQIYHLAFDVVAGSSLLIHKRQFRSMQITVLAELAAQKIQRRFLTVSSTMFLAVGKTQRRLVNVLAATVPAFRKLQRRGLSVTIQSLIGVFLRNPFFIAGREFVRTTFATILEGADLGVTVYDRMPYSGAETRSVVLTITGGSTRWPALGKWFGLGKKGSEEHYRLQADCYYDDPAGAEALADAVEQAIVNQAENLKNTYGIYDVKKIADIDSPPPEVGLRESRILLSFDLYRHRVT
jgi:hypothetical protein